eukprot:755320-Hanusia_phi.AAC.1
MRVRRMIQCHRAPARGAGAGPAAPGGPVQPRPGVSRAGGRAARTGSRIAACPAAAVLSDHHPMIIPPGNTVSKLSRTGVLETETTSRGAFFQYTTLKRSSPGCGAAALINAATLTLPSSGPTAAAGRTTRTPGQVGTNTNNTESNKHAQLHGNASSTL